MLVNSPYVEHMGMKRYLKYLLKDPWLVVVLTILKNEGACQWEGLSNYIMENKKCLKPSTRPIYLIHLAFSMGFSMKILNHQQRGLLLALAIHGGGCVHAVTLGAFSREVKQ